MTRGPVILLGHVDHGKSSVFRSLVGEDARTREDARGNTVDFSSGAAGTVTLLDVPGHRDYRANTYAAVAGAVAGVLVVAADEGLAAQSRDHAAFAAASGLSRLSVWWTKVDRVDAARLDARRNEARRFLGGLYPDAPELILGDARELDPTTRSAARALLQELACSKGNESPPFPERGFLWIDRAFVSRTAGRVVTGTWRGEVPLSIRDTLFEGGRAFRVRSLERVGMAVPGVDPGERVAVALSGEGELARGDRLVQESGLRRVSRADLRVTPFPSADAFFRTGTSWETWVGSARSLATVEGMKGTSARLRFARELPIALGDRVVLRDGGGERTIGSAVVVDPDPRLSFRQVESDGELSWSELFVDRRAVVRPADWLSHTLRRFPPENPSVSARRREEALVEAAQAVTGAEKPFEARTLRRLPAVARLGDGADGTWFDDLARRTGVQRAGTFFWSTNSVRWDALAASVESRIESGDFDWETATRAEREVVRWLVAAHRCVALDETSFWTARRYEKLEENVQALLRHAPLGLRLGELREGLGLSRREAVRCLELLDRRGVTVRQGERRLLAAVFTSCSDRAPSPD